MKKRRFFWLVTFCLVFLGQMGKMAYAQTPQSIEVGPHGGISTYIGDINPWKLFSQFDMQLGGLVRYNYDTRWSFRLDYTYEKVKATDSVANWRPERNLNFQSKVHDLSAIVEFNFLDYHTGHMGSSISPYIFAGVSVFMYQVQPFTGIPELDSLHFKANPESFKVGEKVIDRDVFDVLTYAQWSELSLFQRQNFSVSIPFGVGCKLSISKHLAATLEWRMHYTFTDYLDNVHGVYPADHVTINTPVSYDFTDPTGQFSEGQQRGNSKTNDWFGSLHLSVTWKFNLPGQNSCDINM